MSSWTPTNVFPQIMKNKMKQTLIPQIRTTISGNFHYFSSLFFNQFNSHHFYHSAIPIRPNYDVNFTNNRELFLKSMHKQIQLGFSGLDLPILIFNHLINLPDSPHIRDFHRLFIAMAKINPNPPLSTVIALSNRLEQCGFYPNNGSLGIVINCYFRLGRVDFAFSVFARHLKLGFPLNETLFTTLLNGLIDNRMLSEAGRFVNKIVAVGFQLNVVTSAVMIKGLCRIQDFTSACHLLRISGNATSFMYSTVIDSLCKHGFLPKALEVFKEMQIKGVNQEVAIYNNLIHAMCSLGRRDDVKSGKDILKEIEDKNVSRGVDVYDKLIRLLDPESDFDDAKAIIEYITSRGVKPNVITYTALLDVYCGRGQMNEAERMLRWMVGNGCEADMWTYNTILKGYCKCKEFEKAIELVRSLALSGLNPDVVTYNILIGALCNADKFQVAQRLLEEMQSRGHVPDYFSYAPFINGLCRNEKIDEAIEWVNTMKNDGVVPSVTVVSPLIYGLCRVGRLEEALDLLSSLKPNLSMYNWIIRLCFSGLVNEANEVFKKMQDDGRTPDQFTHNVLVKGFLYTKNVERAVELLRIMKSKGFVADSLTVSLSRGLLLNGHGVTVKDKAMLRTILRR